MNGRTIAILAGVALLPLTPASAPPPAGKLLGAGGGCPASGAARRLAALVAQSPIIVLVAAHVPSGEISAAAGTRSPDYVEFPLIRPRVLKGRVVGGSIKMKVYPQDSQDAPSMAALRAADGRPRIYFLTSADELGQALYFAGHSPAALAPADAASVKDVEQEIARQQAILRSWRADPSLPHYAEVAALIRQLVSLTRTGERGAEQKLKAQEGIFQRLEALGPAAAPAIIAQMDDRRPLAFRQIALRNKSPGAWEAYRQYGPEQVVDALDAILEQITGEIYGGISNGGSERERRNAVSSWRIYAASVGCRFGRP
ncbi:MAG: hypothetical protein QOH04_3272 [Sphingomonadales bacterium]|nr:hypothetical protein [Sphingomonadales bacterium]